jgi:hypothetical protein
MIVMDVVMGRPVAGKNPMETMMIKGSAREVRNFL